jgi:hypothetical protein
VVTAFRLEFLCNYLHISRSNSSQLASAEICGAVMKTKVKTARLKSDHDKSPFSGVACLFLLLLAGLLVKFAAFTPNFHLAHWN